MKVAIVGAGWAGCAAAVEATRLGHHVTIFEASRTAGGRARRVMASVAGQPLVLNGAGARYRAVFKVYVAGLYLPRKTHLVDEILKAGAEPRRLQLTMLRDIDAAEFGKMFYRGMEDNMDRNAFAKLVPGVMRMSQVFTDFKRNKAGDVIDIDWVPGTGMTIHVNGKSAGEPFREPEFFAALMRIWLGTKPPDWKLKDALLGKAEGAAS